MLEYGSIVAACYGQAAESLAETIPTTLFQAFSGPGARSDLCLFQHITCCTALAMSSAECCSSAAKAILLQVRKDPNRTYTPLDNLLDGLKAEAAAASAAVGRSTVRVLTVPAPKPVQREPRRSGMGSQVMLRAAPPLQHALQLACHYPGLYLLTGAKPCRPAGSHFQSKYCAGGKQAQ